MSEFASRVRRLSVEQWGYRRAVEMIGAAPGFLELQSKIQKIAAFGEPVLITGESGSGKEAVGQALYLLGPRCGQPFVSVNCPQYLEGNLTVSELFGHVKGSFTGASSDRKGCFEFANGGVVFLDEVGDLHMSAQVMLLRALANGEFQPLGSDSPKWVDVRVVAATNRPLQELIAARQFRHDLYFRLSYFVLTVPALRERGDDWRLLLEHALARLRRQYSTNKRFSPASLRAMETYSWPGNVRELMSIATMGFALADGDVIEPEHFLAHMHYGTGTAETSAEEIFQRIVVDRVPFWEAVYAPFMDRNLNRDQVRAVIRVALREAHGSYRGILEILRLPESDYQKFMDFLRHHQLKP
ncbi:MAG TPA: sigma 54-interacting transcriptional regulator [Thermoanaerobaculia bacterium]|nr:sigma 54-interacting transcriptional regulator [Thermoanaerobaculia bacterium]